MALTHVLGPPRTWLRSFGRGGGRGDFLIHPDGKRLVTVDDDCVAAVWDLEDGRQLMRLPAALSSPERDDLRGVSLKLHPDGVRLFVTAYIVDTSDVAYCWDLATGALIATYDYPCVPWRFVGDDLAVTAHGLHLTAWSLETARPVRTLTRADASWSLYGMIDHLALAGGRDAVELWDLRTGAMVWALAAGGAATVGERAVIAAPGRIIVRAVDGTPERELACPELGDLDGGWSVAVDTAGTIVVIGVDAQVLAIDLASGVVRARFTAPPYAQIAIAASGRDAIAWDDHHGAVWEIASGACRLRASGKIIMAPDGATAICCDRDRVLQVALDGRDRTAARPAIWQRIGVGAADVVAIDVERCVHVHDRAGAPRRTWRLPTAAWPCAIGGDRVAVPEAPGLAVFDAGTGTRAHAIALPAAPVALAIQGGLVAATTRDGEVCAWRLADGALATRLRARTRDAEVLAISDDGRTLAVRSDTAIELWRGGFPAQRFHTFRSITQPGCAAFDADRQLLVSGHEDGALLVRDVRGRAHVATIETGAGRVLAVAIRGAVAAIASADGAASIWDLGGGTRLARWFGEADVRDLAWVDDATLACATSGGLVMLRHDPGA